MLDFARTLSPLFEPATYVAIPAALLVIRAYLRIDVT